jgi:glycosyltransferase involved in cell wall biosynthesis
VFILILIAAPAVFALSGAALMAAPRLRRAAAEPSLAGAPASPRPHAVPDRPAVEPPYAPEATVSVVIPTLNEEGSLLWVLEHLPEWVTEVVLVDGLSTDATRVLARRARPDVVVVHQFRRGKGAALCAGFAAATGEVVVMIDADGSTDPREMGRFVSALEDGADFVKGSRHMDGGGSADLTVVRSWGNRVLVGVANALYGSTFSDLCYGYCAFWRRHVDALGVTAEGFEIETQLVLGAVKAGLEMREVPSYELVRRAGTSNLNAMRDGVRIIRTMLSRDLRRDVAATNFSLRSVELPVWRADEVPEEGERRRVDRRLHDRDTSGYTGPERRELERRATIGTVVAYRVVYDGSLRGRLSARRARHAPAPAYAVDSRRTTTGHSDA